MYLLELAGGEHRLLHRWDWRRLVELAGLGGWAPEDLSVRALLWECRRTKGARAFGGEDVPEPRPWRRTLIPRSDALGMANALQEMLPDIPNHDCVGDKAFTVQNVIGTLVRRCVYPGEVLSPLEDFSGARKSLVRDWIANLREHGEVTVSYLGTDADGPLGSNSE